MLNDADGYGKEDVKILIKDEWFENIITVIATFVLFNH